MIAHLMGRKLSLPLKRVVARNILAQAKATGLVGRRGAIDGSQYVGMSVTKPDVTTCAK